LFIVLQFKLDCHTLVLGGGAEISLRLGQNLFETVSAIHFILLKCCSKDSVRRISIQN